VDVPLFEAALSLFRTLFYTQNVANMMPHLTVTNG
jgi:hypothetical protein